jgi:hypothetical protein
MSHKNATKDTTLEVCLSLVETILPPEPESVGIIGTTGPMRLLAASEDHICVHNAGRHQHPVLGKDVRQVAVELEPCEVVTVCDHLATFGAAQLKTSPTIWPSGKRATIPPFQIFRRGVNQPYFSRALKPACSK